MSKTTSTIQATGRRKASTVSIFMKPGTGVFTINDRSIDDYFNTLNASMTALKPFNFVEVEKKEFDVVAKAHGGGITGQSSAFSLACARALVKLNKDFRDSLKKEGLLVRDSRQKERKKPGQPGARKRFQFSKR